MIPAAPKFYPQHAKLLQRYVLLLSICFIGIFFSKHRMYLLLLSLLPVFYLFTRYPSYKRTNTSKAIGEIANSVPQPNAEPANCMSLILALLWPHMFTEERVNYIKENLQYYLNQTPLPYFRSIQIKQLTIGSFAPQITQISVCKNRKAPEHSILFEMQANYFPSLNLTTLVTPAANMPAFNISFTDLTMMFDTYILFEFTPDPFMENIPFWTSMDFFLVKPPEVRGFNIKLFQSSNLINKESIKTHMSSALSNLMYNLYGVSNAFVWDRVTGLYKSFKIIGPHGLERASLSHGELLRISRLKTQALEYCHKLHIAEPLNIQIKAYKDVETTTFYLTVINDFLNHKTIETLNRLSEEFTETPPSQDELDLFFEPSYRFFVEWARAKIESIQIPIQSKKKKKENKSQDVDAAIATKILAPMYNYVNFLQILSQINPEIASKANVLHKMTVTFHNKLIKSFSL